MRAVANFVWVKPTKEPERTGSGIILSVGPRTPDTGTVIAIGAKCDRDLIGDLKEGDIVIFDRDTITRDKHPETGEEVYRFPDRNILGTLGK